MTAANERLYQEGAEQARQDYNAGIHNRFRVIRPGDAYCQGYRMCYQFLTPTQD